MLTDYNFLQGRQLPQEGKVAADVQELNGCNHGGVAVPGAVLVVKKKRQKMHPYALMRVGLEPVNFDAASDTNMNGRLSRHGYRDDIKRKSTFSKHF